MEGSTKLTHCETVVVCLSLNSHQNLIVLLMRKLVLKH